MTTTPAQLSGPIPPGSLVRVVDAHGESIPFGGPLLVVEAPQPGAGSWALYSLLTPSGSKITVYRGHLVPLNHSN